VIPVKRVPLTQPTRSVLRARSAGAKGLAPGASNIESRWAYFLRTDSKAAQANRDAIAEVRSTLDTMFHGKCCYCEKIIAKDIEHFLPKTKYPKRMFSWANMLRACKDCNFEKLAADPNDPKDPGGGRSLLDPTRDRPEEFVRWDLLTGQPVIVNQNGPNHRGERTVTVCDLRNQKFNEQRRKQAARFKWLLLQAATETPLSVETTALVEDLIEPGEQWLGVVRQIVRDPAMAPLVQAVEARLPQLAPRFAALRWTHP
jgi:uncharacterized protein (TIGR02646 family)